MATRTDSTRDLRWNFRVAASDDALVRAASEIAEVNMTNFVRCAAVAEARHVLADRRQFALEPAAWKKFNEILDRPARVPAGLKNLFSKPSVFGD